MPLILICVSLALNYLPYSHCQMNSSKRTTEALRIQWLESTLEFTREKINLEDVLASLMKHLAETTVSSRAEEQKMARLIAKSDTLLQAMR